jgi:ABC-type transporter Mla subunit MlaD
MAATANRWKLGLFVLTGFFLGVGSIAWIGGTRSTRPTMPFVTYFQESVQGLDVGAPVKFRGVTVGKVSKIRIAPDRRSVQVEWETYTDELVRIGLRDAEDVRRNVPVPDALRVQIAATGVVGPKFVEADIIDPARHPPPAFPFETPPNYIPSMPSTLRRLEERATEILERLPELGEDAKTLLRHVDQAVVDADAPALVREARCLLAEARAKLDALDVADLSSNASATLMEAREVVKSVRPLMLPLGDAIARLDAAVTIVEGDLRDARLGERLDVELETLHRALDSLRAVADLLERDPGALLHGKSQGALPPRDGR